MSEKKRERLGEGRKGILKERKRERERARERERGREGREREKERVGGKKRGLGKRRKGIREVFQGNESRFQLQTFLLRYTIAYTHCTRSATLTLELVLACDTAFQLDARVTHSLCTRNIIIIRIMIIIIIIKKIPCRVSSLHPLDPKSDALTTTPQILRCKKARLDRFDRGG